MSDEYTPTTEDIMQCFSAPRYKIDPQREGEDFAAYLGRTSMETMQMQIASEQAARRWLAAHDREVAARTLRDLSNRVNPWSEIGDVDVRWFLRAEADRIEKGNADVE